MSYEHFHRWRTQPVEGTPDLTVVIPAYNEAERIVPTIGAVAAHVSLHHPRWELVVADDGSTDVTVSRVEALGLVNARVSSIGRNLGKGGAVRRGMLEARGRRVLFADADQSTPIEELGRMMAALDAGADVAIGSRAAAGGSEANRSALRQFVSNSGRSLIRRALHLDLADTQCGFKLFRREAAEQVFRRQTIEGFSFDLEVLYIANLLGLRIAEVPVSWVDAPGSKVETAKEVRRFLADLVAIRDRAARGVYAHA